MVYVRKPGETSARRWEPAELVVGGSADVRADSLVSCSASGRFLPLAVALEADTALRDELARAIRVPSLEAWSRVRLPLLALALLPLGMLLELDRELVTKGLLGPGRLLVTILLAAYIAFELTRKTPRMPAVAAAALLAIGLQWVLVITRQCGRNVHPAVWGAAALAVLAGTMILVRAPRRARIGLEILDRLGITRAEANAVQRTPSPPATTLALAVLAAAGLPLMLWALRHSGARVWAQALAFAAYGIVVPELVALARNRARRSAADVRDREDWASPGHLEPRIRVVSALSATALGLAVTASLLYGAHHFFDAGAELARCTGRLDEASRRLLALEANELTRRIANVRQSSMLVLMTTAVMPLAEERIYRGVLMKVLVRRYGAAYGLFASAAAFGLAHVGIYEVALYQTVLLGIGFGIAYAEGGLIAAFAVHCIWNLLNIA